MSYLDDLPSWDDGTENAYEEHRERYNYRRAETEREELELERERELDDPLAAARGIALGGSIDLALAGMIVATVAAMTSALTWTIVGSAVAVASVLLVARLYVTALREPFPSSDRRAERSDRG